MNVRVKLFGAIAQQAGAREIDVDVPDDCVGSDLMRIVGERFPKTADLLRRASLAVNRDVVPWTMRIHAADEIALMPPSSGGAGWSEASPSDEPAVTARLCDEISVDEAIASVSSPSAGGTAVFIGTVRDHSDAGDVDRLDYEAYEGMAEKLMLEIATEAAGKWGLAGVAVRHAVGVMPVGSPTIVVACAAAHRDEAFDACRYVVDELKRRVPIWKKERGPWGERWI